MADLNLEFDLGLSKGGIRWLLTALCLALSAGDVGSESVTLNTYYPAPSGVYQYMVSTNQTFLARDSGQVNIGLSAAGASTLNVGAYSGGAGSANVSIGASYTGTAAPSNGLIVQGKVGIGTTSPANQLQVAGSGGGNVDFAVNGRMQTGDASGNGGVWLSNGSNMFVGQNGTDVGFWTATNGWSLLQTQTGAVGIGTASPDADLDVAGLDKVVIIHQTGCHEVNYSAGVISCASLGYANNYATTATGLFVQEMTLGNINGIDAGTGSQVYTFSGTFLCCPCPTASGATVCNPDGAW